MSAEATTAIVKIPVKVVPFAERGRAKAFRAVEVFVIKVAPAARLECL